jgi:hypothetical protein
MSEWRDGVPPKDGRTVIVQMPVLFRVYWDDELSTWVLVKPLNMETALLSEDAKWKLEP